MPRAFFRSGAGVICGGAAWFSTGTLALTDTTTVGLVPPWWWLGISAVLGVLVAQRARSVPAGLFVLPAITILPWLGMTSAPQLLWAGPLVALAWMPLGIALVRDRSAAWAASPAIAPLVHRAPFVFVLSLAMLATFAAWTRLPLSGDEPHYLVITSSLLHDGDVDLGNDYDLERYREFYAGSLEPRHTTFTRAGRHYPVHGLGTSVLVAPGVALAGTRGARATMLIVSALGIAILWSAVRSITRSHVAAWAAIAVLVLQVPFAAQSTAIYPDAAAAAVTCFALWLFSRVEAGEHVSTPAFACLGLALCALPWLHIRLSIVAAAFGGGVLLLALQRRLDVNRLAWFLAGPLIGGTLWIASMHVMFETLNPLATLHHAGSFTSVPMGVVGLLTDQEFGLLPYASGLAFAVGGLWIRSLPITSISGITALFGTLVITASHDWWGGTNSPARFLVPVVPVLAFAVGNWWPRATLVMQRACGLAMVMSATFLGLGAMAGGGRFLVNVPDGKNTLFAWLSDTVDVSSLVPSFFKPGNVAAMEASIAGLWGLAAVTIIVALTRFARRRQPSWSVVSSTAIVWIVVSSSATIAWTGRAVKTQDRSQFALLSAAHDQWLTTGLASPLAAIDRDEVVRRLAFRWPSEATLAMVRHQQFPAARYRVEFDRGVTPPSEVTVRAGRLAEPVWQLPVRDGVTAPFGLAAPVRRMDVVADERTPHDGAALRLRPLGLLEFGDDSHDPAQHVRRYGTLVVYARDQLAALEPEGFWLWAGRQTSIVIANRDGAVPSVTMTLRAGDLSLDVQMSRGSWNSSVSLAASTIRDVVLPAAGIIEPVSVAVSGLRAPRAVWVTVTPR